MKTAKTEPAGLGLGAEIEPGPELVEPEAEVTRVTEPAPDDDPDFAEVEPHANGHDDGWTTRTGEHARPGDLAPGTRNATADERIAALERQVGQLVLAYDRMEATYKGMREYLAEQGAKQTAIQRENLARASRQAALDMALKACPPGCGSELVMTTATAMLDYLRDTGTGYEGA